MSKIKAFAKAHKIITAIIVIVVLWGAYAAYGAMTKAPTVTKYVVETALQGTVIASVSGTGQVAAQSTVAVKPQVSETVTQIYVTPGEHVAVGQLLMQLDTTNEEQALEQAQLSMQSAQLALAKLQQISTSTLLQDQSAVIKGQQSIVDASTTLASDYQNGFATLSSIFVNLQSVMSDVGDFAVGNNISKTQANPDAYVAIMPTYLQASTQSYSNAVAPSYAAALSAYQQNLNDYHAVSRNSDRGTLDALFSETYQTTQLVSASVKAINDLLNFVINNYPKDSRLAPLPTITTTYQTTFGNDITTANNNVASAFNVVNGIANDKDAFMNDQLSLVQASETYNELVSGPDPLDVQSQQISIQNAQFSLQTAEQNLAYCSIRAPIAGIVSSVPSVVGETVASPAASIVSDGQLAQVTLNEIDAAKVVLGNKATLTFDALPDLSLAGTVTEIDPVGTVSAGVVNYNVQVNFVQPANTSSTNLVKPGMSVTADIVTQVDQNVIALPNAAVHTSNGTSYVLEPATPLSTSDVTASQNGGVMLSGGTKTVPVTVGISNDTETEIASGVNVGDQVITQTMTAVAASTASTAASGGTSALRALTGGGAGGFGGGAAGAGVRVTTGGGGAATGR